jgi:hypothetical protein
MKRTLFKIMEKLEPLLPIAVPILSLFAAWIAKRIFQH